MVNIRGETVGLGKLLKGPDVTWSKWLGTLFPEVLEIRRLKKVITSWWFQPTHLKNMLVKLGSPSPIFGVNIKHI